MVMFGLQFGDSNDHHGVPNLPGGVLLTVTLDRTLDY